MSVARPPTDSAHTFESERTELIGGVVVDMASEEGLHGFTVVDVANKLRVRFDELLVLTVGSLHVDDFTMTDRVVQTFQVGHRAEALDASAVLGSAT
jgi:hypothetical protein